MNTWKPQLSVRLLAVGLAVGALSSGVVPARALAAIAPCTVTPLPPTPTAAQRGDFLRATLLCNLQPIRTRFAASRQASHRANVLNALISALGGIATGVVSTKVSKGVGIGTAALGAGIAFYASNKSQDAQLVSCMTSLDDAIAAWDTSAKADPDFVTFRKAVADQVRVCPELGNIGQLNVVLLRV